MTAAFNNLRNGLDKQRGHKLLDLQNLMFGAGNASAGKFAGLTKQKEQVQHRLLVSCERICENVNLEDGLKLAQLEDLREDLEDQIASIESTIIDMQPQK